MDRAEKKHGFLNRLSTEQLKELLRADVESSESNYVSVIMRILEVIEQRESENGTECIPEIDKAWTEFQEYYNIPEGDRRSLYPYKHVDNEGAQTTVQPLSNDTSSAKRFLTHRVLRYGFAAVIAVIILMSGMVVVQAAGIDVFGALGRWTAETFHFEIQDDAAETQFDPEIQTALADFQISEKLIPTWQPTGFEVFSPEFLSDGFANTVLFVHQDENGRIYHVKITHYNSESYLGKHTFEKDGTLVEEYTSNGKTFYIFSNINTITAVWSDGVILESITGDLTEDEVKLIVDSIGD